MLPLMEKLHFFIYCNCPFFNFKCFKSLTRIAFTGRRHGSEGPRVRRATGPGGHGSGGPRVRGTTGQGGQGASGPGDREAGGPGGRGAGGGIKGSACLV
jgi:hypothetical protein